MSGHSKWASIKHQKGVADARRGKLFTKLTREILVAVRDGGSNPDMNVRLRLAVQKARDSNMPLENIERAIKRGSGELEGVQLVELMLEGYGPSGAAILVEALTDNRNRTLQDIRNIFSRGGGNLGESGSVAWLFDTKGLIMVDANNLDTEELALQAIDAGAEDVNIGDNSVEIYTKPEELEIIRTALEQQNIPVASAELAKIPRTTLQLEEKAAIQTLRLLHKLEEIDETQGIHSNVDFSDDVVAKFQEQA